MSHVRFVRISDITYLRCYMLPDVALGYSAAVDVN
jgi:hypothetical protein